MVFIMEQLSQKSARKASAETEKTRRVSELDPRAKRGDEMGKVLLSQKGTLSEPRRHEEHGDKKRKINVTFVFSFLRALRVFVVETPLRQVGGAEGAGGEAFDAHDEAFFRIGAGNKALVRHPIARLRGALIAGEERQHCAERVEAKVLARRDAETIALRHLEEITYRQPAN